MIILEVTQICKCERCQSPTCLSNVSISKIVCITYAGDTVINTQYD